MMIKRICLRCRDPLEVLSQGDGVAGQLQFNFPKDGLINEDVDIAVCKKCGNIEAWIRSIYQKNIPKDDDRGGFVLD